jgi:regulator of sigma E protease
MDYFIGFILLLGVLIFIHEFGHFIIAKACGVRVETFSIGMGKKLFRFRRGETEYVLSILPLGGYVKLTGQDPREEVPPELSHKSFREKPLWKRAAIVLAGPLFNAALAVIILTGLYAKGVPTPAALLQRVLPGSIAEKAGFKSGDEVTSVRSPDGRSIRIREASDLETLVGGSVGTPLEFNIRRHLDADRFEEQTITFTPVLGKDRDSVIGVIKERGVISGVENRAPAPVVASLVRDSWAGTRGLPSGFWVTEVEYAAGGVQKTLKPETFEQLEESWAIVAREAAEAGQVVLRGHEVLTGTDKPSSEMPEPKSYTLAWTGPEERIPPTLEKAGLVSSELVVLEIKEGSPAEKLGLKPKDHLLSLNGERVVSFMSFREKVQEIAGRGQPLQIAWLRNGQKMEAETRPEIVQTRDELTEAQKSQFQIGAAFMTMAAIPSMTILKAAGPIDALNLGFSKSYALTMSMLSSFYHLIKGDISPKTLGGPILIGKIAGESFRQGYVAFFRMMAFISLNLFILNLFPIPILDGGHLILYTIEAIRRKPLSIKIVEAWTTAGFFILMGLVVVVFFNDLNRLGVFKFITG